MTPDEYDFHTEPKAHQLKTFLESADLSIWAFFDEMGLGKSKMVIDTAAYLYQTAQINGLLIVAPKGCYRNWVGELDLHWPKRLGLAVRVWNGKPFIPVLIEAEFLSVRIMNTEAFQRGIKGIEAAEAFLASRRCLFIIDESTGIKDRTTARTRALVNLGGKAPFRRILSGFPNPEGPGDFYSQCQFLDPKLLGYTSYYAFRNHYSILETLELTECASKGCRDRPWEHDDCHKRFDEKGEEHFSAKGCTRCGCGEFKPRKIQQVVDHKNLDELSAKLATFSSHHLKADCLDLPPKVYQRRDVELTGEQKTAYEQMRTRARAELEGQEVTATMALTQMTRLHQIVCGFLPTEAGYHVWSNANRPQALFDVIDEARGKVIVWANYVWNVEMILIDLRDRYGEESVVAYYGSTPPLERMQAVSCFQNNPDYRFFVGTPSTAGYGLTLTAASTVVYYSNSFKLEQRLQSEDRAHRIGQTKSVTYVDLVAPGTIDERIVKALRDKKELADLVMGGGWKEML